jgi:hypothetical protein
MICNFWAVTACSYSNSTGMYKKDAFAFKGVDASGFVALIVLTMPGSGCFA